MTDLTQTTPISGTISKVVATCTPAVQPGLLQRMLGVWRQRRHLERLPDHMRRDIGLSDGQITQEIRRSLWDAPQTWRC